MRLATPSSVEAKIRALMRPDCRLHRLPDLLRPDDRSRGSHVDITASRPRAAPMQSLQANDLRLEATSLRRMLRAFPSGRSMKSRFGAACSSFFSRSGSHPLHHRTAAVRTRPVNVPGGVPQAWAHPLQHRLENGYTVSPSRAGNTDQAAQFRPHFASPQEEADIQSYPSTARPTPAQRPG
jgi:hypothetical protein